MTRLNAFTLVLLLSIFTAQAQVITTVAGGGPNNMPALEANLFNPASVAVDSAGNRYIAVRNQGHVFKVDPAGRLTILAGTGTLGFSGDGGPAASANLYVPAGVAVDSSGNVYVADEFNYRVRRVDQSTGIITTYAGNGNPNSSGDGGLATSAAVVPGGVAVDAGGNLYIADVNSRVRRVDASGIITTYAGTGVAGFSGDGGTATAARLINPCSVAVDGSGNLYILDCSNRRVRKVNTSGIISTVAGNGTIGYSGDGGPATAAGLYNPFGISADSSGNLYIADTYSQRIRRVDAATGIITTVVGNGTAAFSGDGGPATSASLQYPQGVTVDAGGNLYVSDSFNYRVRVVNTAGVITTMAGNGFPSFSGDGRDATTASLAFPPSVAVDSDGNVYINDLGNSRIRRVDRRSGIITTMTSTGIPPGKDKTDGLALDGCGNLYFADSGSERIRRLDRSGNVIVVAGNGTAGFSGDGGRATAASLNSPEDVALDGRGNLYIADSDNNRIRRVDRKTGIITTVAGDGTAGFSGDGGAATGASLNSPHGVVVDSGGNLYIADSENSRIRLVDRKGTISTFAGDGTFGFSGDGGPAFDARLGIPIHLALDGDDNLYIADPMRIRRVDHESGIITTVAGNGIFGFSGDGGPPLSASLAFPFGVATAPNGDLYIADSDNQRIRKVSAPERTHHCDHGRCKDDSNGEGGRHGKNGGDKHRGEDRHQRHPGEDDRAQYRCEDDQHPEENERHGQHDKEDGHDRHHEEDPRG